MSLLAVPIIAVLALFLVILISGIFFVILSKVKEKIALLSMQLQSTTLVVNELQMLNEQLQQKLDVMDITNEKTALENTQVSQQLEHRIKQLQHQTVEQQQLIAQWQDSQGQDKFYNRAFKLAEKGADIEEIISECELPRAEVEMLLSVYHQRTRTS